MASIINASNTSGLIFTSDMSGVLQLQQNGVALPALSVAPAFSAYQSVQQNSIPASTWTKITLTSENFDTNNNFASSAFTPTVAGYYQINATLTLLGGNSSYWVIAGIYKNGSQWTQSEPIAGSANYYPTAVCSSIVYLNGTTDYVELYGFGSAGGAWSTFAASTNTSLNGCLIRGA